MVSVRSIAPSVSVCLSVCMSVRSHISETTHVHTSLNFMCTLPVAEARFSSDDNAIGNESVPIQLAQCWFHALAISNAKI